MQRQRQHLQQQLGYQVHDLHVWPVSANHCAAIISISGPVNLQALQVHQQLADFPGLAHITVEILPSH